MHRSLARRAGRLLLWRLDLLAARRATILYALRAAAAAAQTTQQQQQQAPGALQLQLEPID
jgi:hypothetical protein